MWIRFRFDITWRDLAAAGLFCVMPGRRDVVGRETIRRWDDDGDVLMTLSVRSAFDLTLRALQLPAGSEILLSALTVPDMVRIVQAHNLVPVPVDTDRQGRIRIVSLRRCLTPKSRMLVVAHLFGGRMPMGEVAAMARSHQLIVVEDCAQAFCGVGDRGDSASDVVMHSFGPIKTATALGGAVVRVASPELRKRMANLLASDPVQSRFSFARRVLRFTILKFLSGRRSSSLFRGCINYLGWDFDSIVNSLGRGFATTRILGQIRRQPSLPLLRLLRYRWGTYDFSRIARRIRMGQMLDRRIGLQHDPSHSYWVYPVVADRPHELRDRLQAAGFDATCQARMIVVPAIDLERIPVATQRLWSHVVFVPWYPDLTEGALEEMGRILCAARSDSEKCPSRNPRMTVGAGANSMD
jgi:perosamine synthetase